MAELKTFLFTDICRSVHLKNEMEGRSVTERDQAFIQKILTPHRERIERQLETYGGRVVSTAGDGHFLVFNNTILAAQWAVAVQQSHRDDPIETPGGGCVEVRISVHVGVPQIDPADPNNFVGKSVDYASRLNDYATGAQILVSRSVMAILDDVGLDGISFHLHGRRELKGIGRVEVHELLYDGASPRDLRKQPASNDNRQWTVVPTVGFGESGSQQGRTDTALATGPALKHVGNYELEEVLGSGGMGDVYKGRHSHFNRVRAIKVIKPQYVATGNKDVIRRFYREIKAIGALEHKNIVVAIDSSSPTDRLHYLVMEYIDGVALNDLVDQHGPLSSADACEIIRQAARGLQYIHRHGMVHRDLKPSNMMLTLVDKEEMVVGSSTEINTNQTQGVVKILDLGLALLAGDEHDRLTRFENRAMGTGMYMSPEQWKTTSVDIRADIYSLGCTLYHLLAGNPPFYDSDLRPEKAHEKSRIPPIHTGSQIPRKLWDVLRKMLAKKAEDRYQTPAEVIAALAPFVEGANLASLVRGYVEPTEETLALQHTKAESEAKVDTWLSRASHFYPSRRWLLQRGLPFVVVTAFFGLALWMAYRYRQGAISNAMERERVSLQSDAKRAAEKEIGPQITERFKILQNAAHDESLVTMIQGFDTSLPKEELASHPLQQWIKRQRQDNNDLVPSDSWFINDRHGVQIARHPLHDPSSRQLVKSFLGSYAYRNYFHGQEKDLPKGTTDGVTPIESPHLSAVYRSSNSRRLKVAFSVPIWSQTEGADERVVLGVLSMSVDLRQFEVLDQYLAAGDKKILLVDLREDYLEKEPESGQRVAKKGLILYHPLGNAWKETARYPRVDSRVLTAMEASPAGFVSGYRDPLSKHGTTPFWGAFEPVFYDLEDPMTGEKRSIASGWDVLVETPAIE